MSLAQQFNKPDETPLHSSGYGEVAGADGSAVGDVGLSLEQRRALENARKFVAGYNRSQLGTSYVPPEARHYKPRPSALQIQKRPGGNLADQTSKRQAMNAGDSGLSVPERKPSSFREPPTRGYNPYS